MREGYMPYPDCDARESGCKVGWRFYRDEGKARECAEAARHNARIAERQGYDFGFCAPGSIKQMSKGQHAGLYEVCIP